MTIIKYDGIQRDQNRQWIVVSAADKYGVGMIAYFKNSLNGQNVQRLAVNNPNDVSFWYDEKHENYVLEIRKFSIANESIRGNYQNFRKKYDVLMQDKISHI